MPSKWSHTEIKNLLYESSKSLYVENYIADELVTQSE